MQDDWEKLLEDPDFWAFVNLIHSIRFYVNFIFFAIPWWCFSVLLNVYLLVFNDFRLTLDFSLDS